MHGPCAPNTISIPPCEYIMYIGFIFTHDCWADYRLGGGVIMDEVDHSRDSRTTVREDGVPFLLLQKPLPIELLGHEDAKDIQSHAKHLGQLAVRLPPDI